MIGSLIEATFSAMIVSGPRPLMKALSLHAELDGVPCPSETEVARALLDAGPNDKLIIAISRAVRLWDHLEQAVWAGDTECHTRERRVRLLDVLEAPPVVREALDEKVPPYLESGPAIIKGTEVTPWFDPTNAAQGYYWTAYVEYLRTHKGWLSVDDLDRATSAIVANLANPTQTEQYQSKGLVIGHVQSGKTANFTGVIAKAADAGYRLVIVLTGTTNILRRQTQRRIDKELVGRELVGDDYEHDPDWGDFLEHGGLPSRLGWFDWLRLTGPDEDFRSLGYGVPVLDFKKLELDRPFFDPANLRPEAARIMIVKKNATVLARVAKNLKPYAQALRDVPALVIDDESDLASLDTTRPIPGQTTSRTRVNGAIVRFLRLLPRAQYVGYTATPFANVFVNPTDNEDLFPRDFIVALDPPEGYMGAAQFHDLGEQQPGPNETDLVRSVRGPDEEPDNLLKAIDSFVLAGGLKLYREVALGQRHLHHTMLVHVSQLQDDHASMSELIERTVVAAAYRSPDGVDRLRRLWETDIRPVSLRRGPEGGCPESFEELLPALSTCLDRLFSTRRSVLIVNGTKESDTPDFDRAPVWRVLVGGNKLSRGYTIEGLTVSYYRRSADAADTLMQMGRWFGYRAGYQDLVRLYIGRNEPKPNGETIDLYKAFEGVCRDEIAFREELRRYAGLPGDDRITPYQVPPLVQAHILRPTSRNKMWHAHLLAKNLGGEYREPTVAPFAPDDVQNNQAALANMLFAGSKLGLERLGLDGGAFSAYLWKVPPDALVRYLRSYRWLPGRLPVERDIEFLSGTFFNPQIDDWLVVAPQLVHLDPTKVLPIGDLRLSVKNRSREESQGRYGVYSEPDHVRAARYVVGLETAATANDRLTALRSPRRGVVLLYPVQWYGRESVVTPGFAWQYPINDQPKPLIWGVQTS
jgi:Z1 domain